MRRPGFTLIEVVLALTLLVLALSLVGPALLRRVAPATFESVLVQAEAALRVAREDSRRLNQMLFVYAEPDETRGVTVIVTRASLVGGRDEATGPAADPAFDEGAGPGATDDAREILRLPARVMVQRSAPEPSEPSAASAGGSETAGPASWLLDDAGTGTTTASNEELTDPVLMLVILPDGSVVAPGEIWLTDDSGRAAKLHAEPAIGRVRFVRSVDSGVSERADAEAPDPAGPWRPEDGVSPTWGDGAGDP